MRMDPRIEKLAGELIALPLAELPAGEITERIAATLGDADPDVAQAALDLAAELVRQRTADAAKHAETLLTIFRLANATHCPDGTNAVTWLQGLGLIEPDGAGWYMVTPQASTRVVGQ
jgi:hypothetical protein